MMYWYGIERGMGRSDAHRLLDERLARGDSDTDDYARRRELLDRSELSP